MAKIGQLDTDISFNATPSSSPNTMAANDLNQLMADLKSKFLQTTTHADKVQILTLKPESWTIDKAAIFFECQTYTVRHANALKAEYGVLAKQVCALRKGIFEDDDSLVLPFYQDDEFSRLMPGI